MKRLVAIHTFCLVQLPAHGAPLPSDHCKLLPGDAAADGDLPRVLRQALLPSKTRRTCKLGKNIRKMIP